MRVALISDIHGNLVAFDAVLEDCRAHGVDQYWLLGDYCALGPEPAAVLDRVAEVEHVRAIRGNTDRYVVTGDGPPPTEEAVRRDTSLIATYAGIAASFAWTRGFVTGAGWFDWLAELPLEMRTTAADGTRILAVHAAPGLDDGEGVHRGRSNEEIGELVADADADLVFVGHTHEPMVRRLGNVDVVNLGSVSNPQTADVRASYVLLDLTDSSLTFVHRRVDYDREEFVRRVHRSRHPSADFILSYPHPQRIGQPAHHDHVALPADGAAPDG